MSTPIQKLVESYQALHSFLTENNMISEDVEVQDHYRKILLLSCASFYESEITSVIRQFVKANSTNDMVYEFLNSKAIERQYHTYFDWKNTSANINSFLGLFGNQFKQQISSELKERDDLQKCVKAFIEIGRERNKMVHENFLEYNLEKTFDEIILLHNEALDFISFLKRAFNLND